MSEPVLDGSGIVSGVRQCVAAAVAQHVRMDREIEASALAKPFGVPVNRVRSERAAPLSREDEAAVRELPAQLAERPDFLASERVNARLAALGSADVQ